MMYKVLISDNVSRECVEILQAAEDIEVTFNTKLTPEEFKKILGEYDALIVRSATKVKGEFLEAAEKLRVIGRAGAGVDNIDVKKATEKGIVVMNTPGGNTVSTAEHAFSLMLSLARNIPQADRSIKEGGWDRIARLLTPESLSNGGARKVIALVKGNGGIERTLERANMYLEDARNSLARVPERTRVPLIALAEYASRRTR